MYNEGGFPLIMSDDNGYAWMLCFHLHCMLFSVRVHWFVWSTNVLHTRIRIRLYPQTICCGFKSLRVHTYADSLRFRASTRIRENNTNTPDLLTEHALSHVMNPRCCWLVVDCWTRVFCVNLYRETRLIRRLSLYFSGTTIWLTKPDHQAFVRPGLTKNLRGRAWLGPFVETFHGHISGNWYWQRPY